MKKLSALFTVLGFACTLLTALPARAEDNAGFTPDTDDFFIVVGDNPTGEGCILQYCYHSNYGQLISTIAVCYEKFDYGDVLTVNEEFNLDDAFYPKRFMQDNQEVTPEFEKVGTCEDFFTTRTLTANSVVTENSSGTIFSLTDDEGNIYYYHQQDSYVNYPVTIENPETGDVYTFACYQKGLLLLLETSADEKITPDGDANVDGILDILDVIMVNKAILGKIELPSDRIPHVDFNGDGVPDATDSLTMLKMIVGLA